MNTLEHARQYLNRGFSVIPLHPKSKIPSIPWTKYQHERPTEADLQSWFGSENNQNIGIVTGSISGITVVDLDSEKAAAYAKDHNFPKTPTVKTGKGFHAYYKYKDGVRNFQKRDDLPGIDLRGDGGYIVSPPSVHASGKLYQWLKSRSLDDLPLAELPECILAKRPEDKTTIKELWQGVEEGSRNDSLARLAGYWSYQGLSLEDCLENAFVWNSRNIPPLPEKEVETTVRSIYEKHHSEAIVQKKDIYTGQYGQLDNSAMTALSAVDPYSFLVYGNQLSEIGIEIDWLVDKIIPSNSVTLFSAQGGAGKTTLITQLADAVTKGLPFLGHLCKQSDVVYLDYENPKQGLARRVSITGADKVGFWGSVSPMLPPRLDEDNWQLLKQFKPCLLVIDTLRSSQSRDENDSKPMAAIMQKLVELRNLGFTIIVLHHCPKGNVKAFKGNGVIGDLSDHLVHLYTVKAAGQDEESDDYDDVGAIYRFGTGQKTRFEPFRIFLRFNEQTLMFDKTEDPDEAILLELRSLINKSGEINQTKAVQLIKEQYGIKGKGSALKLLSKCLKAGYLTISKHGLSSLYTASYCPIVRPVQTYPSENGQYNNSLSKQSETMASENKQESQQQPALSNSPTDRETIETKPLREEFI